MLRLLVIVLLLANAVMLAFNLGWLDRLAGSRGGQTEPERLARQVDADAVKVLTPQAASQALAEAAAAAAAAAAPACMQAGPFEGADTAAAEKALAELALPPGAWQAERGGRGGIYLVYMGRFADTDAVQRKQKELERLQVAAEPLRGAPELQPGLSLGRFEAEQAAAAELAQLTQRGVRTARVVMLRAATPTLVLSVPAALPEQRERLAALHLPGGGAFVRCVTAEAAAPGASAVAEAAAPSASAVAKSAAPSASAAAAAAASGASAARAASAPASR